MNASEMARHVLEKHTPKGDGSWKICVACGQEHVGGSETFPIWPCDAVRLAQKVLSETPQ